MSDHRGRLTSEEVKALGLLNLEYRYYDHTPNPDAPRDDETCDMWSVVVWADGTSDEWPHCDNSVAEDGDGELEGIGGAYAHGGTFSYLSDDHRLSDRYNALMANRRDDTDDLNAAREARERFGWTDPADIKSV